MGRVEYVTDRAGTRMERKGREEEGGIFGRGGGGGTDGGGKGSDCRSAEAGRRVLGLVGDDRGVDEGGDDGRGQGDGRG